MWANHQVEVGLYLYGYASRWIPQSLFSPQNEKKLARVGKGFSAINPEGYNAAMLVIIGSCHPQAYPQVKGHQPNIQQGKDQSTHLEKAINLFRKIAPNAGSYSNEADYFEPDWQKYFWGTNYPKLLAVKKKYDPDNFFACHHCVGSENKKT